MIDKELELYKRNVKNIVIIDNFSKSKDSMFGKLQKIIPNIEIYNFDLNKIAFHGF